MSNLNERHHVLPSGRPHELIPTSRVPSKYKVRKQFVVVLESNLDTNPRVLKDWLESRMDERVKVLEVLKRRRSV